MTATKRMKKTPEQIVECWIAGQAKVTDEQKATLLDRWEAGMDTYLTVGDVNYERFYLDVFGKGYVVVEWDEAGNVGVLS